MDVLIRHNYSQNDVDRAQVKRSEFKRNTYTSGSANLDDLIALRKAVVLCDSHARKFKPRAVSYELHPAKNLRIVQGNCDVCKTMGLATLFLPESLASEERRKYEDYRRGIEYAHIVAQ